jgi:hypothetical protein
MYVYYGYIFFGRIDWFDGDLVTQLLCVPVGAEILLRELVSFNVLCVGE